MRVNNSLKEAEYRIGGIKGDHCRDRIEHTISHLNGVKQVDVNMQSKKVKVSYDPDVIPSGYIAETLQSLGYSVQD